MHSNASHKSELVGVLVLTGILVLACSRPATLEDRNGVIRVKVSYLQNIALPPDAVLIVQLRELSGAGAPPIFVAERRVDSPAQLPVLVELRYDRRRVDPSRRYELAAWIHRGERDPLMSGIGNPVLTGRYSDPVNVMLRPSR